MELYEVSNYTTQARGMIDRIYIHWSGGKYYSVFDDYHFNVKGDGTLVGTFDELTDRKSHTYMRNSRAIGIAACSMYGGSPDDFGDYPTTDAQVDMIAQLVAKLCIEIGIPIDIQHVLTHAEAADNKDGRYPDYEYNGYEAGMYGPDHSWEKWDFWKIKPSDEPYSGGDIIRDRALYYANKWANS